MLEKLVQNKKLASKIGEVGLIIALVLAVPKMILGVITGSISVLADGVNNLMDSAVSIITMVGMKMSKKPMDKNHPYGYGRIEHITGFIISIVTAIIGVQFLIKSVKGIFNPEMTSIDSLTRLFMILSIILKSFYVFLNHGFYNRFKSTIYKANRQDALFDVIISATVLISSFFFKNYPILDSIVALIISLLLIYSAYETLKDTISPLIGETPSREDLDLIEQSLKSSDKVDSIHNIYIDRKSMDHAFATADVEVDPNLTIGEIHDELERITIRLRKENNIELVIHVEPKIEDELRLKIKEAILNISGVTSVHDILLGRKNFVTIAIDADKLKDKNEILERVMRRLKELKDKEWILDVIADLK